MSVEHVKSWESGDLVPTPREWARLVNMVYKGLRTHAMLWRDARARISSPRDADVDFDKATRYAETAQQRREIDVAAQVDVEAPEPPRPEDATTLGEAIRRARIIEGLTQEEVAQLVGTTDSTVSSWELGATMPVSENFEKLVQLMGAFLERWRNDCQDRPKPVGLKGGTSNPGHAPGFTNSPRIVRDTQPRIALIEDTPKTKSVEELGVELAQAMLQCARARASIVLLEAQLEQQREIERDMELRVHAAQGALEAAVERQAKP